MGSSIQSRFVHRETFVQSVLSLQLTPEVFDTARFQTRTLSHRVTNFEYPIVHYAFLEALPSALCSTQHFRVFLFYSNNLLRQATAMGKDTTNAFFL